MLEILKTFWAGSSAAGWQIVAGKSVTLRDQKDSGASFFVISNDLFFNESPPIIGTSASILGESVVPIVATVAAEPILRCIGTGFFISCSGLLITAAHVVTGPIERRDGKLEELDQISVRSSDLSLYVLIAGNPLFQRGGYILLPIEWSAFLAERAPTPLPIPGLDLRITSDIAICKVASRPGDYPHQPLTAIQPTIRGVGIDVGSKICAIGYAGMAPEVALFRTTSGQICFEESFNLHGSVGQILERFPRNLETKEVPTPGPCFSFDGEIPGGMSGAPIFDQEGLYVHGVVSKGWKFESGDSHLSYGSMLWPSMEIPVPKLGHASLADLQKGNVEGFAKIFAPGA